MKTDFSDPASGDVDDNHPRRLAVLDAPFSAGVAVSLGRDLLEVTEGQTPTLHPFRSAADSGVTPDLDSDLDFGSAGAGKAPGVLVSGSSLGNGDGVWAIDSTWTMTNVNDDPNVSSVVYDRVPTATSLLTAAGQTPLYDAPVSSIKPGLLRQQRSAGDRRIRLDLSRRRRGALRRAELRGRHRDAGTDLGTQLGLALTTPMMTVQALTKPSAAHSEILLVGGAIEALLASTVYALYDRTSLVEVDPGGSEVVL